MPCYQGCPPPPSNKIKGTLLSVFFSSHIISFRTPPKNVSVHLAPNNLKKISPSQPVDRYQENCYNFKIRYFTYFSSFTSLSGMQDQHSLIWEETQSRASGPLGKKLVRITSYNLPRSSPWRFKQPLSWHGVILFLLVSFSCWGDPRPSSWDAPR